MSKLSGVAVALGITGSIAAVKTVELAHELRRRGATVRAVMTHSARGIVHEDAVEYATGNPVTTTLTGRAEHIELCGRDGWADVFLIAPATANTVGKLAAAIDDSPVTTTATTAIGAGIPVVVAPAMHEPMYDHPGVEEALERLATWDVAFVDPRIEEGKAKIATEEAICSAIATAIGDRALSGKHVVVTAGATGEPVDPVRLLTNRASGRTGREIASACAEAGARVTLVHGYVGPHPIDRAPVSPIADHRGVTVVSVETAEEMREATLEACVDADGLVSAAAIGDYTLSAGEEKLRSGEVRSLDLEPTEKVLDAVRERDPDLPIVGFKVETGGDDDSLIAAARDLRSRVDLSFVVANDASVMGQSDTSALFVTADDVSRFSGDKPSLADEIASRLAVTLGSTDD